MMMTVLCSVMAAVLSTPTPQAPAAATPSAPPPAGHWEGTIQVPGQALEIQVDLASRAPGAWQGTISIPAQNVKALPLTDIAADGAAVTFGMKMVPGAPVFKGTLSKDGKSMTGDFTQGGAAFPFALTWKGEAQLVEAPPKNKPVAKELEGAWEGTLDANGTKLRLVLKLANKDDAATGTLTSLDQGGIELPVSSIVQTASHLAVTVPSVSGAFEGDLKEGRLDGTWTQGPASLPLVLTKRPQ
jgi:hypothetical protein